MSGSVLYYDSSLGVTATGVGSAGQVLTSNGGGAPTFQSVGGTPVGFISTLTTSATNATGDGTQYTLICDNVVVNAGSGYDNTTGIFTAPSNGSYAFNFNIFLSNLSSSHTDVVVYFQFSGGSSDRILSVNPYVVMSSTGLMGLSVATTKYILAAQTVKVLIAVSGGTKTVTVEGGTPDAFSTFNGFKIG